MSVLVGSEIHKRQPQLALLLSKYERYGEQARQRVYERIFNGGRRGYDNGRNGHFLNYCLFPSIDQLDDGTQVASEYAIIYSSFPITSEQLGRPIEYLNVGVVSGGEQLSFNIDGQFFLRPSSHDKDGKLAASTFQSIRNSVIIACANSGSFITTSSKDFLIAGPSFGAALAMCIIGGPPHIITGWMNDVGQTNALPFENRRDADDILGRVGLVELKMAKNRRYPLIIPEDTKAFLNVSPEELLQSCCYYRPGIFPLQRRVYAICITTLMEALEVSCNMERMFVA